MRSTPVLAVAAGGIAAALAVSALPSVLFQTPPPPAGMSDPVKVALITSSAALAVGAATLLVSLRNGRLSEKNARIGAENASKLDGRLTQLLSVTSDVAHALGVKEGTALGHAAGLAEGEAKAAERAAGQAAGLELTGRRTVEKDVTLTVKDPKK